MIDFEQPIDLNHDGHWVSHMFERVMEHDEVKGSFKLFE